MRTSRLLALIIAVTFSLCSASAFAQTDEEMKQAQEHFQKGAEWFAKGEYAKAVVEFMSGHSIAPNAMFLYNVSLAYERLGNISDALSAAERSRQFSGMPDDVKPRNDSRIVAFEVMLRAEDVAESQDAEEVADAGDTTGDTTGDGKGDGRGEGGEPKTITRPDGIKALGWTGLVLAVAGGGFAFGGYSTNAAINRDVADYEEAARNGDTATYNELRARIEQRQKNGKLFYAIGAAATGVGATLFVIDIFAGTETVPVAAFAAPSADGARAGVVLKF